MKFPFLKTHKNPKNTQNKNNLPPKKNHKPNKTTKKSQNQTKLFETVLLPINFSSWHTLTRKFPWLSLLLMNNQGMPLNFYSWESHSWKEHHSFGITHKKRTQAWGAVYSKQPKAFTFFCHLKYQRLFFLVYFMLDKLTRAKKHTRNISIWTFSLLLSV